jgi:transposase
VRLISAQYVKPYVKTNKSDYIDAEAAAEAVARPTMRFVPIKTDEQLLWFPTTKSRRPLVSEDARVANKQLSGFVSQNHAPNLKRQSGSLQFNGPLPGLAVHFAFAPLVSCLR